MKESVRYLIVFILIVCADPLTAQPDSLVSSESSVRFTIANAGLDVNGHFLNPHGQIKFNPGNLAASSMQAWVEPLTIRTGISMRDKHLQGREYFDSKRFSKIEMKSKSFAQISRNKFTGTFDLTIRDITKEVKIPFTATVKNGRKIIKADFKINRLDYQIGEKSMILSDDVLIQLIIVSMEYTDSSN